MIWLTANQNFGRHSAISSWKRDFKTVTEMNDTLIKNWNQVVKSGDEVWVLGNFAWDPESADEALKRLNGNINIICGHFDQAASDVLKKNKVHKQGIHLVKVDKHVHTLSYWPQLEWEGTWSFHGWPDLDKYPTDPALHRINVSCDAWGLKPISLEKTIDLFNSLEKNN